MSRVKTTQLIGVTTQPIPGTQMTVVLIGKGLLLKGSSPKTRDFNRFQVEVTVLNL